MTENRVCNEIVSKNVFEMLTNIVFGAFYVGMPYCCY